MFRGLPETVGRSRTRYFVLVGAVESDLMMVAGAAVSDLLDLVVVLILHRRRVVVLARDSDA